MAQRKGRKADKGQIAIEFLVVIGLMVVIFGSVSFTLLNNSIADLRTAQTDQMSKATDLLIKNAVEELQLQGSGAKKTIFLRAPLDCDYFISRQVIKLSCPADSASAELSQRLIGSQFPFAITYDCPACSVEADPDVSGSTVQKVTRGLIQRLEIRRLDTFTTTVGGS